MIPVEQILVLLLTSKVCSCCKIRKKREEFYSAPSNPNGLLSRCKECVLEGFRTWSPEKRERMNAKRRLRHVPTPRKKVKTAMGAAEYGRQYRKNNSVRIREKARPRILKRLRTDPHFRLRHNLSCRIWQALKRSKSVKTNVLLGCSPVELQAFLEKQFRPGMTWENYGPIWHVDHITPCAAFNLADLEQQKICFHHTNLQPLFAIENLAKGDRL